MKVNTKNNLYNPVGNYIVKVNNRNTRTRCEICSKLKIKTTERHQNGPSHIETSPLVCSVTTWRRSGVFIVNFEHICSANQWTGFYMIGT